MRQKCSFRIYWCASPILSSYEYGVQYEDGSRLALAITSAGSNNTATALLPIWCNHGINAVKGRCEAMWSSNWESKVIAISVDPFPEYAWGSRKKISMRRNFQLHQAHYRQQTRWMYTGRNQSNYLEVLLNETTLLLFCRLYAMIYPYYAYAAWKSHCWGAGYTLDDPMIMRFATPRVSIVVSNLPVLKRWLSRWTRRWRGA